MDLKFSQHNKRSLKATICSCEQFCRKSRNLTSSNKRQTSNGISRKNQIKRQVNAAKSQKSIHFTLIGMLVATLTITLLYTFTSIQSCFCLDSLEYQHYLSQQQQQQLPAASSLAAAQVRVAGLEPSDYVDEAGELEIMANQQQIPTAQLMAAAGHIVPENFFLPGGSIPAIYSRYPQQQQVQQQQQQQQQSVEQTHLQARNINPQAKYARQVDLLSAANEQHLDSAQLIDFNGYNLISQADGRESSAHSAPVDLAEFLAPASQSQLLYEQQQQYAEQQAASEMAALFSNQQHQSQHHQYQQQHHQHNPQQQSLDNSPMSSESIGISSAASDQYAAAGSLGPAYQVSGPTDGYSHLVYPQEQKEPQRPYGLPTKSSSKEPSGMLKPLGNPKLVSSPAIDFVANHLPKTSGFEKLAEKIPQSQVPTVFSFASSKDPVEKTKGFNQKKRNVMKQAEQLAKAMIKSVNDKFGTTIGDQSDIPFLLSSFGPLGLAQNILFDPTLLVTLLNSAEKTYFSDVLPAPAKMAIRPVLNIFRVPNRKRDKANLLNIISYLASGGQTPSSSAVKHRQPLGVEKQSTEKTKTKTTTA